jgi:ribokinase
MNEGVDQIDVLGFGAVAVDDLLFVAHYPGPDRKVEVLERQRRCGGLAATALVAAARLGAACAYAGILGTDELSDFAVDCLCNEGIGIDHLVRRDKAGPIHSIIIVDRASGTRNIFFDARRFVGPDQHFPDASVVRLARILLVDHLGLEGMVRVARIGRDADIPVVADFEAGQDNEHFFELLALTDHLVLSSEFASKITGESYPAQSARSLWTSGREAVVITCGADGSWYTDNSGSVHHCPAFSVPVRDTTGCGDVFHGAYAAALVRGLDLPCRVRFASAAAAFTAAGLGGQAGAPTIDVVSGILEEGLVK